MTWSAYAGPMTQRLGGVDIKINDDAVCGLCKRERNGECTHKPSIAEKKNCPTCQEQATDVCRTPPKKWRCDRQHVWPE